MDPSQIDPVRIIGRVAQAQFPLHHCLWHCQRMPPLRVDVVVVKPRLSPESSGFRSPSTALPGYCALTFTLMSVGSTTRRSVQVSGFTASRLLTPPRCLYPLRVPRTSVLPSASSRSPVARGTLAVQLTLPLFGCVKDFHLQVSAPCQAHARRRCAASSNFAGGEVIDPACLCRRFELMPPGTTCATALLRYCNFF